MVSIGCVNRVVIGGGEDVFTDTTVRAARRIAQQLICPDASEGFLPGSSTDFWFFIGHTPEACLLRSAKLLLVRANRSCVDGAAI
jgi:hypothetical protein